ncbi:hypothetical protein [Nonomuraea sp. NPDC049725]|uniref:hypothetical protein n=1 Tax=Nonomuraea sp. NPDC049725 TaxID=3154508 RepID=UPI00344928BC
MTEQPEPLLIPEFDPKATRRAIRRGIRRTAVLVLGVLTALVLVATLGSALIQTRGDREGRMVHVLGTALQIAKPAYTVTSWTCCRTEPLSMSFTVTAAPMRAHGGFALQSRPDFTVRQNLFGGVEELPWAQLANTTLTQALFNMGTQLQRKPDIRQVLARLPQDMNALAVVEFERPLTADSLVGFAQQYGACPEKVVYEARPGSAPITWGSDMTTFLGVAPMSQVTRCSDLPPEDLAAFRSWVKTLRQHDEPNLRRFDLNLARLRKASGEGLAYGYVDQLVTVKQLRKIIEDRQVRAVRLADVTFDLERP